MNDGEVRPTTRYAAMVKISIAVEVSLTLRRTWQAYKRSSFVLFPQPFKRKYEDIGDLK